MLRRCIPKLTTFITIILLPWIVLTGDVSAETYNVNAVVPYDPPTVAAVITTPSDEKGTVFYDAQQTISGTCQLQNPRAVVSIWKAQTVLGSAECSDGTFSIPVILHLGENNLVARTANANGIYGPDSTKLMVQLKNPIKVDPLPPGVNQPVTVEDYQEATNQGGITNLSLSTEAPFEVLPATKQATVKVVVDGGQQPYVLQLKWGDGSTESHTISEPGTYEFTHTYLVHKTYSVFVAVRDVLGAYTEYMFAVISGTKAQADSSANASTNTSTQSGPWRFVGIVWYYWIVIIVATLFLIWTYLMGYRRGKERSELDLAKRKASAAAKRKKRKLQKP